MDNFNLFMVDDDLEDRQLFEDAVLTSHPRIHITFFEGGLDLLKFLEKGIIKPNVIFLDLHMAQMNGEETLKHLRSQSQYDDIPIVLFSGVYNIDYISYLFRLGANRYMHKPNDYKTLVSALDRAISSVQSNNWGGTSIINYV